eukprot:CAMPEP_0184547416 /NCGR_PEP_ID=MMETSP0199_2-20130426/5560_1 /TAXON_ID=1112570 /ORGANISM="Thraustochytrium sp., Strain LLF1b" /LENGTH=483 /DNA_ID=CAMNT_0026941909 /DNA_START=44 /DNA_END=1492 /DNA_ORIENTATION=-
MSSGPDGSMEAGRIKRVLTPARVLELMSMSAVSTPPETLTVLRLDGIEADKIENGALEPFVALKKIFLQKNKLKTLPKRPFAKGEWPPVTFLDATENRLTSSAMQRLCSWKLESLITLRLMKNEIESIPSELFECMPNLCALVLNDNKLQEIKFTKPLKNLNTLIISGNEINELGEDTGFQHLPGLRKLSAAHNKLTQFPDVTAHCPLLAEIRLSGNQIKDLNPEGSDLPKLEKLSLLDLSSTQLASVEACSPLKECEGLTNVAFTKTPLTEDLGKESDKAEYAKAVLKDILSSAQHLQTLDGKPLTFFGQEARRAKFKARPVAGTTVIGKPRKGKDALNKRKLQSKEGGAGEKTTASPNVKKPRVNKGTPDTEQDQEREQGQEQGKQKEKEQQNQEQDKSDEKAPSVNPFAERERQIAEATGPSELKLDVIGSARTGVEEVIERKPKKEKKEKKKKDKKKKSAKDLVVKSATWATQKSIDAW